MPLHYPNGYNQYNKSYNNCVGRKYREVPKLYRPFTILIGSGIYNEVLIEKNKIRFIKQLLR